MSIGIQVWLILRYLNRKINLNIFYQILLLLCGDISLNPGPCQMQFIDGKTWEPRSLHFCHLNVSSLLSKIAELREITNSIRPAAFGITESKLGSSVTNAEVNINGYSIIRNDRNRNGGGVAYCIRNDLCFNIKNIIQILLNVLFLKLSYQKLNLLQSKYFTELQMQMIF